MKILKTAKYKKLAITNVPEENNLDTLNSDEAEVEKSFADQDILETRKINKEKKQIGYELLNFDFQTWDSPEQDSITVDDKSSYIHSVGYRLIGEGEIYPEEYQGAIDELNELLEESVSGSIINLTLEQRIEISKIQIELHRFMNM